ncbi:hypothetical protein ACWKWP_07205 [Agromyces soli]
MPLACRPASLGAIALVGALAAGLSGCTTPSPKPTVSVEPTAEAPIFANDEEALAAAEAAYAAYNAANDRIGEAGGEGVEALRPLVNARIFDQSATFFEEMKSRALRIVGATTFDSARLADWGQVGDSADISVYICRDVSGVRVLSSDGSDVTPTDRVERQPLLATFTSTEQDPAVLYVDGLQEWSGDGIC